MPHDRRSRADLGGGTEANQWKRHGSVYRLANAATQRRASALLVLPALRDAAPSRLWLGVGQFFGMVWNTEPASQSLFCGQGGRAVSDGELKYPS
jgi:hypothetical protein